MGVKEYLKEYFTEDLKLPLRDRARRNWPYAVCGLTGALGGLALCGGFGVLPGFAVGWYAGRKISQKLYPEYYEKRKDRF